MASATTLREFVEPLGANRARRRNGMPLAGDYFPVPLRTPIRIALRVLALLCESPTDDPKSRGNNGVRLFAEEIIECYMAANFKDKTGVELARVFHRVVSLMDKGESEESACQKVLQQLEAMEAAQ